MTDNEQLLAEVARVYQWLDTQTVNNNCKICGKCCDFERFDHRLFITSPELIYFATKLAPDKINPMANGRCPYNTEDKCGAYEHRFAGCRIFCCQSDKDSQSRLSEAVVAEFKSICTNFQIPYRYVDLKTALNDFSGQI